MKKKTAAAGAKRATNGKEKLAGPFKAKTNKEKRQLFWAGRKIKETNSACLRPQRSGGADEAERRKRPYVF